MRMYFTNSFYGDSFTSHCICACAIDFRVLLQTVIFVAKVLTVGRIKTTHTIVIAMTIIIAIMSMIVIMMDIVIVVFASAGYFVHK